MNFLGDVHSFILCLGILTITFCGCGRERSNPIDPNFPGSEGLGPPSNLSASGGIEQIVLTWDPVVSGNLSGYGVYRATSSTGVYLPLPGEVADSLVTTGRTTFADTSIDLSVAKIYFYRVNAVDVLKRSSALSVFVSAEALEDNRPPAAPTDLSVVSDAETGSVTLTWAAPQSDTDNEALSGLSGYRVLRSRDSDGAFVEVATVLASEVTFVDTTDLELDTRYSYRVSAFDANGNEGAQSGSASITTTGAAAPAGLRTTDRIARIEVEWNPVNEPDLLGYLVLRSTSTQEIFEPVTQDTLFTTAQTRYADSNVSIGTVYFYRVQSVVQDPTRGILRSDPSGFVDGLALTDESPPAAPSDLAVTLDDEDPNQILLTWTAPQTDGGGGELTGLSLYRVFRSPGGSTSLVLLAETSSVQLTYQDTTVALLTQYFYAISAVDSVGNEGARSGSVLITTRGLAVPVNVSATSDITQVTIQWTANTEPELTGYEILRYADPAQPDPDETFSTLLTTYVDSPLAAGSAFVYRVRAVGTGGLKSELSPFVSALVPEDNRAPATPGIFAGSVLGSTSIRLSWSAPKTDEGGQALTGLSGFRIYRALGQGETGFPFLAQVDSSQVMYDDTGLSSATTYSYRISAVDGNGNESAQSSQIILVTDN